MIHKNLDVLHYIHPEIIHSLNSRSPFKERFQTSHEQYYWFIIHNIARKIKSSSKAKAPNYFPTSCFSLTSHSHHNRNQDNKKPAKRPTSKPKSHLVTKKRISNYRITLKKSKWKRKLTQRTNTIVCRGIKTSKCIYNVCA